MPISRERRTEHTGQRRKENLPRKEGSLLDRLVTSLIDRFETAAPDYAAYHFIGTAAAEVIQETERDISEDYLLFDFLETRYTRAIKMPSSASII